MTLEKLKDRVDTIIKIGNGDPEAAHSNEDDLHLELLEEYLPPELWKEIERLSETDFPRWCA